MNFPNRHKEQQKVTSDSPAQGVGALEERLKLSLDYLSALKTWGTKHRSAMETCKCSREKGSE